MKKSILILAMIGIGLQSYAQEVIYSATIKKEQVPQEVLEAIDVDFPDYTIEQYVAVPVDYVEDNVYVNRNFNAADMDSYQIILSAKGREIVANYNSDGKLMSSVENLKNVALPQAVSRAIESAYPGWKIGKDNFHMSKYGKGATKEHYKIRITKDGKTKHVYTDDKGKIIK